MRLVFAPLDLVHGVHPAVVTGWLDERLLWPAGALIAVALLVVRACTLRRERWLAAAWFFGMLLPVIQVIPMINLFADRYLYAALPGALWLIADVVDTAARRRGTGAQHAVFGVFALIAVFFAGYSNGRAKKWAAPDLLYREATIAYPQGRSGWTGLGAELQKRHDLAGAARRICNRSPCSPTTATCAICSAVPNLSATLRGLGRQRAARSVDCKFQRGGNRMLRIWGSPVVELAAD